MRTLIVLFLSAAASAGCSFLKPPCAELAKVVCEVGDEGELCARLLERERGDEAAQSLCREAIATAIAHFEDVSDSETRTEWESLRRKLNGEVGVETKRRIGEKLKAAGGSAGRVIENAEDAYEQEQQKFEERSREIFGD